MRRSLALLLLASAALPRLVRASTDDPRTAVRTVLDAQVEAWNRGDLEGFMLGYWRSPELVFCSGATVTKGWEATLERYRKRYQAEGREMGTLRFDAVEVLPFGPDAAAVRGAYRLQLKDGQEPHGLFTLLLRRVDGAWRIVHDHTSSAE
jgi:beta-aspartyl-peptidase (threonine type)